MQKSGRVDTIFVDYTKAFDRVSHTVIVKKLEAKSLSLQATRSVMSIITKKEYIINLSDGSTSSVSQGSHIGSTAFIIVSDDLPGRIPPFAETFQYADDVMITAKICHSVEHRGADMMQFQSVIDSLPEWSTENQLKINMATTKVIQFEKRVAERDTTDLYTIEDAKIANEDTVKYLGITPDRKLNFITHANNTESKSTRFVNAAARLSKHLHNENLNKILYRIYTDPVVTYAASSWYTSYANLQDKIERGQRRMTRYALRVPYRTDAQGYMNYDLRCCTLNIPTVRQRIIYLSAVFLTKIIQRKARTKLHTKIIEARNDKIGRRLAALRPIFNLTTSGIEKKSTRKTFRYRKYSRIND